MWTIAIMYAFTRYTSGFFFIISVEIPYNFCVTCHNFRHSVKIVTMFVYRQRNIKFKLPYLYYRILIAHQYVRSLRSMRSISFSTIL